jgi:hypothetical protein
MKRKLDAEGSRRPGNDERQMPRVLVKRADGTPVRLKRSVTPLVRIVVREFCSRWTPGGIVLHITDGSAEFNIRERNILKHIGATVKTHGKMPDVVVYVEQKNRLVLIEAVTSHGPVNPKRRGELKTLFKGARPGLVFVTAFLDRKAMVRYLGDISWETEVWIAESPSHLIHFNGERFLGPYEQ